MEITEEERWRLLNFYNEEIQRLRNKLFRAKRVKQIKQIEDQINFFERKRKEVDLL